jgi:DNA (cytosine-5)-methyltransferase 1
MDTTKAITHVSLCAGYGGIDIGLSRAIPSLRTVAFSEIEAFACANLVAKMEEGLLDCAPIWTDLKTFPWAAFHGRVDLLSGGYPCQPFSAAGKRLGTEDPRHLWPYIADGIRAMRPRMCFFENVEGHISLGLREVVGELEEIGYKVAWGIFSAREVGAPHQRKRVFILGVNNCERLERFKSKLNYSEGRKIQNRPASLPDGTTRPFLSNALRDGSGESWISRQGTDGSKSFCNGQARGAWPSRPGQPQYGWEPPRVVSSTIPNPTDNGLEIDTKRTIEPSEGDRRVSYIGGVCTCEGASMGDTQHNGSSQCGADATGAESGGEQGWLQEFDGGSASVGNHLRRGLQDTSNKQRYNGTDNHAGIGTRPTESSRRQTQPPLGRDSDGIACGMDYAELCVTCDNRTDELRLLGNGVAPATAERAFRTLLAELIP